MALEQGSGSWLDRREEEERKRREQQGLRSAEENAARIKAAIAAYQESQREQQPTPRAYVPVSGKQGQQPQQEERPVYRVQRGRDAAAQREQEERERGMAQYRESERAAYEPRDTSRPLLSYLPEPEPIGLAEPERPDTGTPSISQTRGWDTVGFDEQNAPEREPEPVLLSRAGWQAPSLLGTQPIAVNTAAVNALNTMPALGAGAQVGAQAIGDWWETSSWSPRNWFAPEAWEETRRQSQQGVEEFQETPAAQYAIDRSEERQREWSADGNLSWADRAGDAALSALDWTFNVPTYFLGTTPLDELGQRVLHGSEGVEPGERLSLGAIGGAIGGALNRGMNPMNPNFVPYEERGLDAEQSLWTPENIGANVNWYMGEFQKGIAQWGATMDYLDSLSPEKQEQARRGLIVAPSGAERTLRAMEAIVNQPAQITQLETQLQQAAAAGDSEAASRLNNQIAVLESQSWTDIVDANINPWADFVMGVLLDPTAWLTGGVSKALGGTPMQLMKQAKFAKLYKVTPEQATGQIAKQMERVPQVLQAVGGEKAVDRAKGIAWLFERTPESKAAIDTQRLVEMAVNAFTPISDVEDARRVLSSLVTDGGQSLINGLTGLQSPAIRDSFGGLYRWGAGLIGNTETAKVAPLWRAAGEQLANLRSLSDDAFNPTEFIAEVTEVMHGVARRANGLADPNALPFGASKVRVKKVNAGTGVLEYLNDKGKVIQSGGQMKLAEAQAVAKQLKEAGESFNWVTLPTRVQKAIMSDMFLALRPSNWIRNALSATTMLLSEDAFTWLPNKQISDDLMRRFGGVMPWVDANATEATGSGAIDWIARTLTRDPNNPVSNVMKWFYDIPYGDGVGGEGWFRAKARYTTFNRGLEAAWKQTVRQEFAPALQGLGLPDDIARELTNIVETVGITGSRAEMAGQIRQVLDRATVPIDVRTLFNLTLDDVTPAGGKALQDIVNTYGPQRVDEAAAAIRKVFDDIRKPYASLLSQASVQPVVRYTDEMITEEVALVRDMLRDMGKRAGIRNAAKEADKIATNLIKGTQQQVQSMLNDIPHLPSDSRVVGLLNDYFATLDELRSATRRQIDMLGREAIGATGDDTKRLWQIKWQGTRDGYAQLAADTKEATDRFRQLLRQLASDPNLPYESKRDWASMLKRYMEFDEGVYQGARQAGLNLGATKDTPTLYAQVIDSYRGKVDRSFSVLLDALKRYPTTDNFDLFSNAMQMADSYGRRQAARLAEMASEAVKGQRSWDDYFKQRNIGWQMQWLDATLTNNDATLRQMVENGLTKGTQVPASNVVKQAAEQMKNAAPRVAALTDEVITELTEPLGMGAEAAARALRSGDQDSTLRVLADILGVDELGDDAAEALRPFLANKNGMPTQTVGDVAETMLKNADSLEQRILGVLPELLAGKPNRLTPAQRLRVVDLFDQMLPRYDDALAQAMRVGDDMAGWIMLNFNDKRNFDTILGFLSPFPYFWSRMLPRSAMAALTKPALVNAYYDAKTNIRRENEQAGIPQVRYGTVPNPVGVGPSRLGLGNLLDAMIPGVMYLNPNPFVEPDEATNDTARWLLNLQRWTPGLLPANQYVVNSLLDNYAPRKDGISWNSGFQLSDIIPAWKIAYYNRMARTGEIPADAGGVLSGGDEFDYGRVRKGIELEGQGNTEGERLWAEDVVHQARTGDEPLPGQWSGAEALAAEGAQRAGSDRLWSLLTSYFIGMPSYNWTPEEEAAITARDERRMMGYDPVTNPYGSKAAVDAVDEATGELGKTFSMYGSEYPQVHWLAPADNRCHSC